MNSFSKFCPNVFLAKCSLPYEKGDEVMLTTKRGKDVMVIIWNLVKKDDEHYYYSYTRCDGFDSRQRALNKIEKLSSWAASAERRSMEWWEKSREGEDFLKLGEPIKVGHHSESRHRNLIKRNWDRLGKSVEESKKAEAYNSRISYYEGLSEKITLAMPESIEYFELKYREAVKEHKFLKDNPDKRQHSYDLQYANKRKKEMEKKWELAKVLWDFKEEE
jgi:hypothetical protein